MIDRRVLMNTKPWIAEYQKWNVNPSFIQPDPSQTLSGTIAENLEKFQQRNSKNSKDSKNSIKLSAP